MVTRRVAAPAAPGAQDRLLVDGAPSVGGGLQATICADRPTSVIRFRGSLRATTAATLREAVEAVLAARPSAIVIDLSAVTADDELGLWAVPAVAGDAGRCGVQLTVVAPNRNLRTRLRRLGGRYIEITDTDPARGSS
jgi:anti-anti-sigma regulatory factor